MQASNHSDNQKNTASDNKFINLSLLQLYLVEGQPFATVLKPLSDSLPQETSSVLQRYAESGFDADYESFLKALNTSEQRFEEQLPDADNTVKKTLRSLVRIRKAENLPDSRPAVQTVQKAFAEHNYDKISETVLELTEKFDDSGVVLQQWLDQFNDFQMTYKDIDTVLQQNLLLQTVPNQSGDL